MLPLRIELAMTFNLLSSTLGWNPIPGPGIGRSLIRRTIAILPPSASRIDHPKTGRQHDIATLRRSCAHE
jgi:hypothetical protein